MSDEKAVLVPIKDIHADYRWNSRTIDLGTLAKSEEWAAFRDSMKDKQDTPIVLRPVKGKQNKYQLVVGFRRYTALSELGKTHIRAFIRDMTDAEARSENVRENTARTDLSIADRCWGIGQLLEQRKASNAPDTKITDESIAREAGLSQGFVNRLLRVYGNGFSESPGLDDKVMKAWREMADPLALNEMLALASEPKSIQMASFLKRVEARGKKDTKGGRGAWIKTVIRQATTLGEGIGALEAAGVLKVDSKAVQGYDFSALFDKIPENATKNQKKQIAEALGAAYTRALEGFDDSEDDDSDDSDDDNAPL